VSDGTTDLASRFESLRYVLPGAYATIYIVLVADTTRLQPFQPGELGTGWALVGLLVSFLLGYLLHLFGVRSTRKKKVAGDLQEFEEAFEAWSNEPARGPPRGPHDVVNVLRSNSRLQWSGVRPLILAKFNKLTGRKVTQADLDKDDKLRWFVYHFCYSYILKSGAAAEANTNRAQLDLARAFCVAMWVGFGAACTTVVALAFRAHLLGPMSTWWESPVHLVLIAVGTAAPFALGPIFREHQDRVSKRLAGSVYEAFLAT
jgi:hypothetical protein